MERERLLLSVPEAAVLLGLGRSLVYEMVLREEQSPGTGIASVKIGRCRRIPRQALDDFIGRHLARRSEVGQEGQEVSVVASH